MLLEFHQTQDQIAQGGHDKGATAAADAGGIFSQADVAAVVGSVFTGSPMVANGLEQPLRLGTLSWRCFWQKRQRKFSQKRKKITTSAVYR